MPSPPPLLDICDLRVLFRQPDGGIIRAVDGISLSVQPAEIHGIVGESGSGKTVTASSVLGLIAGRGLEITGKILWRGQNLIDLDERELQRVRGREIAMVFQNAQASLNPALRIDTQLEALLRKHQGLKGGDADAEACRLLASVRLPEPRRVMRAYAHECSGGMAQRVAIAMALACRPKLLILDEPTAALDVTTAVEIVELLHYLRTQLDLSVFLISHDLNIVARSCDRVSVMRTGKIVETNMVRKLFSEPAHAYTKLLIEASSLVFAQAALP